MEKDFHNCDGHCSYCEKQVRKKCPIQRNYNDSMFAFCLMGFMFLISIFIFAPDKTYADTLNLSNDLVQIDYVEIDSATQMVLPLPITFNTNVPGDSLSFSFDGNLKNNSWQVAPFGSYNNSTDRGIFILVNPVTGKHSIQYGNKWAEGTSTPLGGSRHTFISYFAYGTQYLKVDNQMYAEFAYKPNYSYSINQVSLFQRELTGSSTTICDLRGTIYHILIRQNGNIIYNLSPCYRRSTDSLGLYDSVSHTFYEVNKGAFLYDGTIPPLNPGDEVCPPYPGGSEKPGVIIPDIESNPSVDNSEVMRGLFIMFNDLWVKMSSITIPIVNLPYTVLILGIFIVYKSIYLIKFIIFSLSGGE